jgi:enterochelin esterase-like enzyme
MKKFCRQLLLVGLVVVGASAAEPTSGPGAGAIVLGPDDVPAVGEPPTGFAVRREQVAHGRLEMIEYDSRTVGVRRKMQVYTPPDYKNDKTAEAQRYPVVYLLHGIGGDETEWQRFAQVDVLLDNLIADGKAVAMIVVMPNGRAQPDDRPTGNVFASAPSFARFERDLLDDVIPTIESRYAARSSRDQRAVAGLSMGGGQALNFGLSHIDTFAYVGGFSAAPNTRMPTDLLSDPAAALRLKLLWLSCGNQDNLLYVSQRTHRFLKEHAIPHLWHVDGHGHTPAHWQPALYHFVQRIFR